MWPDVRQGLFRDAAIGPEELIRQGPAGTRASLRSPLTDHRADGGRLLEPAAPSGHTEEHAMSRTTAYRFPLAEVPAPNLSELARRTGYPLRSIQRWRVDGIPYW